MAAGSPIAVRLPERTRQRLKDIAHQRRQTVSEIVVRLIEEEITREDEL